jgi:hypothetical protein
MVKRLIQELCGELRRPLLVSEVFARSIASPIEAVLAFSLKGFGATQPVFAPTRPLRSNRPRVPVWHRFGVRDHERSTVVDICILRIVRVGGKRRFLLLATIAPILDICRGRGRGAATPTIIADG